MFVLPMLVGPPAGKLFGELYDIVEKAIEKSVVFKSELGKMKSTLESIIPLVKEIDQFNQVFDRRKEEAGRLMEKIKEGNELVLQCSEVKNRDYWKRMKYTGKLRKLEESLKSYFQIVVLAQQARDTKEILWEVKDINFRLNGQTSFTPGDNLNVFRPSCAPPPPLANPVGFNVPLGELKMELFKVDVSTVVLSAPAGCGKTTLAVLLCHDIQVKEKFKDNIFFIPVSQKLNMEVIVQRIFQHKSSQVPQFLGDRDADMVSQLRHFFEQLDPKPLIVLDDVWPESESVLDNFKILGQKVLVTSRSDFPKYGSPYKLKPLNDDDAMTLFRNAAFEGRTSYIPEDVVKKIVKACKRFPIALITVGKSLCGEPAEIWKTRELELSKIGSIFEHVNLLDCLQMSLNALDNKHSVKDCFMDVCSFPEDQRIPVTTLIDMWEELYKLEVPDQDGVLAVSNLHKLTRGNLLDSVITRKGTSGSYLWHFVTQHDLFRELTIRESNLESIKETKRFIVEISANDVPDWWIAEKKSISSQLLSISTDQNFSSSWCNLHAPEVEVMVLNLQSKNYSLPEFIEIMEKLKVLVVTNYGYFLPQLKKFNLLGSPSSLRRIRMDHVSLPSSCFTSIKLKNLRKITLVMCNISQAFGNSSFQLSESLPNVAEIVIDCCDDLTSFPVEICQLAKLKKLSITDCHYLVALPEEIGNLERLEVLRLCYCIRLSGLPSTIGSLLGLRDLDISGCSDIKGLPQEFGKLCNLKKFNMTFCSKIPNLPQTIKNLEHLEEVVCDEENSSLWKRFTPLLKKLEIQVYKEESTLDWL